MITVKPLGLERVVEIVTKRVADSRGYFSETFNQTKFHELGVTETFVQDNHSHSARKGTLRGLHYQADPMAQAKLVRVVRGSVFDVAVDIRKNSEDYGKWTSAILSAEEGNQLFIPAGFAHGFVTLEDDTHVLYKVDNPYSSEHDDSIRYDDPAIRIGWPDLGQDYILSSKDVAAQNLCDH